MAECLPGPACNPVPFGGDATYWHTGPAQSVLLIASDKRGTRENRFSFRTMFQGQWDAILDRRLQGKDVSRDVEPLLTWRMFPTDDQWLSSDQAYLRIHQPLHVHLPWWWPDYQGWLDYHVVLYVDGNRHLRAWVADWECNVESGAKHDRIMRDLAPEVESGMQPLQDSINTSLAATDAFGPYSDVYYLPGSQIAPVENAGVGGNTADDITIAVVS